MCLHIACIHELRNVAPYVTFSSTQQRNLRKSLSDVRSPLPAITIPSATAAAARHNSIVGLSGRLMFI